MQKTKDLLFFNKQLWIKFNLIFLPEYTSVLYLSAIFSCRFYRKNNEVSFYELSKCVSNKIIIEKRQC